MLEGLEAVVINFSVCSSIIDFRIDANTFKKEYIKSDRLINSKPNCTIEDLSTSVQNFGAYSLCNHINFTDSGIPFLMTQNIRHNYIDWDIDKYVDDESHALLYKSHCKKGQVLVTMAGEYLGRVAVYDRYKVCSSNQAIAKVTLKPNLNPYIVSTFLNSRHGQNQINRFKTITGQPNINMSLIKSLKIPVFSDGFELYIENLISESERKRNATAQQYQTAETLLLETLGLNNFEHTTEAVNVKSFKESFLNSGRLDAEYYQKKYEEITTHIKSQKYDQLGNLVDIKKSIEPGSDAYLEEGVPFIRVSNLNKMGLSEPDIHLDGVKYKDVVRPRKDTILLSKDGSVGIAYKVSEDMDAITSGAILHLSVKTDEVLPDYLTLVLNSKVVQMQAERDAGGSILQHWKPSEIEQVEIPIVDKAIQKQIATLVQESFRLKKQSEQLLETAKRAVEIAIEENEETAMQYCERSNFLD